METTVPHADADGHSRNCGATPQQPEPQPAETIGKDVEAEPAAKRQPDVRRGGAQSIATDCAVTRNDENPGRNH